MARPTAPDPLDGVNLLDLAPRPLADSHESGDRVVVVRPRPEGGWRRAGQWVSWFLSPRRLRLDALGSFAWERFDGRRQVREIAAEMRREFGEDAEPAEERLGEFVRLMRREGLLEYPEWDAP